MGALFKALYAYQLALDAYSFEPAQIDPLFPCGHSRVTFSRYSHSGATVYCGRCHDDALTAMRETGVTHASR